MHTSECISSRITLALRKFAMLRAERGGFAVAEYGLQKHCKSPKSSYPCANAQRIVYYLFYKTGRMLFIQRDPQNDLLYTWLFSWWFYFRESDPRENFHFI